MGVIGISLDCAIPVKTHGLAIGIIGYHWVSLGVSLGKGVIGCHRVSSGRRRVGFHRNRKEINKNHENN